MLCQIVTRLFVLCLKEKTTHKSQPIHTIIWSRNVLIF